MRLLSLVFLLFFFAKTLTAQSALETGLFDLPDVIFEKIESPKDFEAAYKLKIKQPLDHKHPEKGSFYQRVFLSHKGFDRPTVICTEGYDRSSNRVYELTQLLEANQLDVEHRFFGESKPENLDYQYLTLEQATADLHHINELFRNIYNGKWVSTGISKGGQTTIFYRYFYPNDVDVSVPYVAPLNLGLEENRIYSFLDTVGTDECRAKIKAFQTRMLKNREQVLPKLFWYAKGAKLDFEYLSLEQAFEYAVLEYSFSFWQWGTDCATIPAPNSPLDTAVTHFLAVSGIDFFSDKSMEGYASHYYQAAREMGYYGYQTQDFKGLLKALPTQTNPSAIFAPDKMKVPFDGILASKVDEWLKTNGNNFIYINGNSDTWSATAVRPSPKVNSVWFFLAGKDHAHGRIKFMTPAEKEKLATTLEAWLGVKVDREVLKP